MQNGEVAASDTKNEIKYPKTVKGTLSTVAASCGPTNRSPCRLIANQSSDRSCCPVANIAFSNQKCADRTVGLGMVASSLEFQTKILRKSVVPDEYKLYRAALE